MSEADFVFITNPLKGAVNVPVIGVLSPGANKVEHRAYERTVKHKDADGNEVPGCVDWKQLPGFTVRDPAKHQGPKDMSADEAVAFALNCNKPELLAELKRDEKRKAVISAIEHQAKLLALESQSIASLKAMQKAERDYYKRDAALAAITKAVEKRE